MELQLFQPEGAVYGPGGHVDELDAAVGHHGEGMPELAASDKQLVVGFEPTHIAHLSGNEPEQPEEKTDEDAGRPVEPRGPPKPRCSGGRGEQKHPAQMVDIARGHQPRRDGIHFFAHSY